MDRPNRIADVTHQLLDSWLEEREKDAREDIRRQAQRTAGTGSGKGQPANFISIAEDMTERKQAEARLQESNTRRERRFRAIYQHAGVGIAEIGADGQFLRTNPAYAGHKAVPPYLIQYHTFA